MPITFSSSATPWQPGGARGAPEPEAFPPVIFIVYKAADGSIVREIVAPVLKDDPLPGEVIWTMIIQWVDVELIR